MKSEIYNKDLTPPCGWEYNIPETNVIIKSDSFDELIRDVLDHYILNKIKVPADINQLIVDYICLRSPSIYCSNSKSLVYTPSDVLNGTSAFALMIRLGKGAFVSEEVAEKRASICASCPMNVQNPGCFTCKGFKSLVNRIKGKRKTTLDKDLKVCGICKCFIQALVHVDKKILQETTRKKQIKKYPDFCWKKKELEDSYE